MYFGDNAHSPYGVRDADDIYDLTTTAVGQMFERGCNLVILACNTASGRRAAPDARRPVFRRA